MERSHQLEILVIQAAGIIAGSQNTVGITRAMEIVGLSAEEIKHMKYYQKVQRKAAKLSVAEIKKGEPVAGGTIVLPPSASTVSTLTAERIQEEEGTIVEHTLGHPLMFLSEGGCS
jgi:hypothetical protein